MSVSNAPSIEGYQLRLPTFEGPLDVLLILIERERLDISNLSLVAVTDGFVAYVRGLLDAPPALLAEFAGIAARLLVLKSRALLPRPSAIAEEPDVDDLAQRLREYQRAKLVAHQFRTSEQQTWRSFARVAPSDAPLLRVVFVVPPVAQLRRALVRALGRLRAKLRGLRQPQPFHGLVAAERDETIAGFIALLALWRRGEIVATQQALFGDILVVESEAATSSADALDD